MNIHTRKQEILDSLDKEWNSYIDKRMTRDEIKHFLSTALDTLLQEVVAEAKEAVGKMDKFNNTDSYLLNAKKIYRNQLRSQILEKLDHLLKEGETK